MHVFTSKRTSQWRIFQGGCGKFSADMEGPEAEFQSPWETPLLLGKGGCRPLLQRIWLLCVCSFHNGTPQKKAKRVSEIEDPPDNLSRRDCAVTWVKLDESLRWCEGWGLIGTRFVKKIRRFCWFHKHPVMKKAVLQLSSTLCLCAVTIETHPESLEQIVAGIWRNDTCFELPCVEVPKWTAAVLLS